MKLSIIIPTLNEEETIGSLLTQLKQSNEIAQIEILIIDAGSTDSTAEIAKQFNVGFYKSPKMGRAAQMKYGASIATGDVYYFVHADAIPQVDYYKYIQNAIADGYEAGCFSFVFDKNIGLRKINSYLTKFKGAWCGGGDQSLFITKQCYAAAGGFNEELIIMEDFEFVKNIQRKGHRFALIDKPVTVSARKYEKNSWLRVQLVNLLIVVAWRMGASQAWLKNTYKKLLRW